MAGGPVQRLGARCAASQSAKAICGNSPRVSPTAVTSATSVTASSPCQHSQNRRGHHDDDPGWEWCCEDRMRPRQVCDHCGGSFGMVTHRWWGNKFCKRRCKDAYLREIMLDRTTIHRWCGLLGLISRSRSLADQKGSCVAPV